MNSFTHFVETLGVPRIIALATTGVAVFAFLFFIITRLTQPGMSLLYGDLSFEDSNQIVTRLEARGIPYQLSANGTQVLVPADQVLRLRMNMAEEGLPGGGSVGYELFDRSEGLGSSSFVQNVNRLRALEGELGRTISTVAQVRSARVHLVLAERRLFRREDENPSASITIQLTGGAVLERGQVTAIQYLVAAAVPGLSPGRVSIIDNRGQLLARGDDDEEGPGAGSMALDEMRRQYERRLSRSIEEMLESSLGPGTVRAEVTADIDFDRIVTDTEFYDPDGQVVRSTATETTSSSSRDGSGASGAVSISEQLPSLEDSASGAGGGGNAADETRRTQTVNFEISRTTTRQIRETGGTRRLSVAVLVDGVWSEADDDGNRTWTPRGEEEMAGINALVRSAIGYDEARGDTLEVVNMQFAQVDDVADEDGAESLLDLDKNDYFRIGEILIIAISAILAILFVVRPLVRTILEWRPQMPVLATGPDQIPDQSGPTPEALEAPRDQRSAEEEGNMIDINQVEGRVKESSLKKVGEIIQKHPDESVSILRSWMFDEA